MKQFKLKVQSRSATGRGASHRSRVAGLIPANMYGKAGHRTLAIEQTAFRTLWKQVSGITAIVEIEEEGKAPALSVIQEVQRNPVSDAFLHVDLHEVSANEKFTTSVVVHTSGEAFGVRNESGVLEVHVHGLRVRALPRDLPPTIEVDVTELKVGQALHVRDLKPIAGVEFLDRPEVVVVSCIVPRAVVEDTPAEAAPAEGAAAPAAGAAAPAAGAAAPAAAAAAPAAAKKK